MLTSTQLREYYADLTQPYFTSALALVHSRFSTNTFPTWSLAQPFRMMAHNGEINTIRGNRAWMEARESVLSSEKLGDISKIRPIIQPGMSDSASMDNVLEFFVMSGLSLPHALAMMVPESINEKNPISQKLKDFYEYHSILMEPWDGPAALLFSDGRYAGGMLDRNGLRPARWLVTKNGTMVVASDKEVKEDLASALPYTEWLAANRIELDTLRSGRKVENSVKDAGRKLRIFGYTREDIERTLTPMCAAGAEPTASMGNDTPLAVLSEKPQSVFNYFRQQFAQVTNPAIDPIREELVMSLTEYIGAVGNNILSPSAGHCKMVRLPHPVKVMSKMGISTIRSYRGAKLFEAVGLNSEVMRRYFGTDVSTIGGASIGDIAHDYLRFHRSGVAISEDEAGGLLDHIGLFSFRKDGEQHAWNPDTISLLQLATRTGSYKKFKEFTAKSDKKENPIFLRDFFGTAADSLISIMPKTGISVCAARPSR